MAIAPRADAKTVDPGDVRPEYFRIGEKPEIYEVPMDSYIIAGQMRANYDREQQDELTTSIESEGMYHPILLAQVTMEVAQKYIVYTNECWGTNNSLHSSKIQPDGTVLILAAGHRRDRSWLSLAKKEGYDRSSSIIDARIIPKLSVVDVINMQVNENFHDRPPSLQYAKAVKEMYYIGVKEGQYNGIADFIPHSPLKEDATRDALSYFVLPAEVQSFVDQGDLSYDLATELSKLQRTIADDFMQRRLMEVESVGDSMTTEQYQDLLEIALLYASDQVKTKAMEIIAKTTSGLNPDGTESKPEWTRTKAKTHIQGKVRELRDPSQLEVFMKEENIIDRATARFHDSVGRRRELIVGTASKGLVAAKVLVEAGAHIPVSERDMKKIKKAASHAGELGILTAIRELGPEDYDDQESLLAAD